MAFVVRFYSIEAFEMKHVISPLHHFFFEEMQCLVGKLHSLCGGDGSCQENRGLLQFWTTATRTTSTWTTATNDSCYLGQLPPGTTATRTTATQDNCHPGQLPPRTKILSFRARKTHQTHSPTNFLVSQTQRFRNDWCGGQEMAPHVCKVTAGWCPWLTSHCDSHHKRIIIIHLSLYNDSATWCQ